MRLGYRSRSPAWLAGIALAAFVVTLTGCGYRGGSVSFVDARHGWVTGARSWMSENKVTVISRTVNGGATWREVGSRKSRGIVGWAAFSTPATGVWAVEIDKILYTRTGGKPWKLATVKGMKGGYFAAASFASATVGWAAGVNSEAKAGGSIAKTTDAGATWRVQKRITGRDGSGGFRDVVALSELTCYALKRGAEGGVWATHDGGLTWTRQVLPGTAPYEAIDFVDELTGWAVGKGGAIAGSADGGLTWTAQVSGVDGWLHGVCCTSASSAFAVGENGVILATTDGGATWVPQVSGTTVTLNSVDFVSADEGWVVSEMGYRELLLHTIDAGQTWQPMK